MPLIDFVIITALIEEFEAVRQALLPNQLKQVSVNSQVWFRTAVVSKDQTRKYQVVVAFQSKMGAFDAISITKDAIDRWQPAYIIMTGIAGSFHKTVKLGDVVVAQQIFYFDMGKAVDQKKKINIEYRPQGYPCSTTLIRQAEALSVTGGLWRKSGQKSAKKMARLLKAKAKPGSKTVIKMLEEHNGSVHFGTMASGSLVITSLNKQRELLKLHGKIIATEMEGAGVMHAAYYQESSVPAIIIKSISDAADNKKAALDKDGFWRKLALQNGSGFVVELIQEGTFKALNTDEFDLVAEKGSPAMARNLINMPGAPGNISFLSFPRLVVPRGPLTGVTIEVVAANENGPLKIHQLAVQYTDSGNLVQTIHVQGNVASIPGYIAMSPIGIYLMIMGKVSTLKFTVQTFDVKKEIPLKIAD